MFKVIRGAVHHKGEVYRKGAILPKTFVNKEQYKHVEFVAEEAPKTKPLSKRVK